MRARVGGENEETVAQRFGQGGKQETGELKGREEQRHGTARLPRSVLPCRPPRAARARASNTSMAAARLFAGSFAPPLRALAAFMGDEDAAALRYVSASSRTLLPLSSFGSLLRAREVRGTLCVEAAQELSAHHAGFVPCLVVTLAGAGAWAREEGEGREEEEEIVCKGAEAEAAEAAEDTGAARLLWWAMSLEAGRAARVGLRAAAEPEAATATASGEGGRWAPLVSVGEAHVRAMLRRPRYRRRALRLARAGALRARDPAELQTLMCRALQRLVATLEYMLSLRARAAADRPPRVVLAGRGEVGGSAPLRPALSPAQRAYLEHQLIYPPPLSLHDVAGAAADLAALAEALAGDVS
jgi:hypothetical protein